MQKNRATGIQIEQDPARFRAVLATAQLTMRPDQALAMGDALITEHLGPFVQQMIAEAVERAAALPAEVVDDSTALRASSKVRDSWIRLLDLQRDVNQVRVDVAHLRSHGTLPIRWDDQYAAPEQVDFCWRRPDIVADAAGLSSPILAYQPNVISKTGPTPLRSWVAMAVTAGARVATLAEAEEALTLRHKLAILRERWRHTPYGDAEVAAESLALSEATLFADLGLATANT
jgi:hypothetical protein